MEIDLNAAAAALCTAINTKLNIFNSNFLQIFCGKQVRIVLSAMLAARQGEALWKLEVKKNQVDDSPFSKQHILFRFSYFANHNKRMAGTSLTAAYVAAALFCRFKLHKLLTVDWRAQPKNFNTVVLPTQKFCVRRAICKFSATAHIFSQTTNGGRQNKGGNDDEQVNEATGQKKWPKKSDICRTNRLECIWPIII